MIIKRLTDTIARNTVHADRLAGAVEALLLALVTRAAAWMACIPTILLTARSIETIFLVDPVGALVSSIALEVVGQSVVSTWLRAKEWNQTKRKSDPRANEWLALGATVVYFATDFLLIGVLEIPKALVDPVHYAALLFPLAQVVSTVMTGERAAQFRREAEVAQEKRERKAKRQARRKARCQVLESATSNDAKMDAQMSKLLEARLTNKSQRLDALLTFYEQNPDAGPTEASDVVGVSRQTIYTYQSELEADGRLKKNGKGWEVLT